MERPASSDVAGGDGGGEGTGEPELPHWVW